MNERDLLKLKERVDKAKSKVSELIGRRDYLFQELKRQWKFDTVEEAQKMIQSWEKDIVQLNESIDAKTKKLEGELDA